MTARPCSSIRALRRGLAVCALAAPAAFCGHLLSPAPAGAESLDEALADAYRYNPRLDAERARLRATDEDVARAMSGYRPIVTGNADVNYDYTKTKSSVGRTSTDPPGSVKDSSTLFPSGYSVDLSQNVFDGFQTASAVNESEANVRAGRETLRSVEQDVLLSAVTGYVDVVRDQAIVQLRENNLDFLSRELKATQDRFAVGEVTRTDVAQAQARRALALSDLDVARANLKTSRATYERVVGHPPSNLVQQRPREKLLPNSLDEASAIGAHESPTVVAALYREQSARFAVDRIRGELLPRATLEASYGERFDQSESAEASENATVTGRVSVPIYEGGEVYARVRQAKHTHVSLIQEIEQFRTETQANVVSAWSILQSTRARIESNEAQVAANRTALQGVREEEKVGQRTLLDVLDAQQELLDSEVQLVTTQRDLVVASYAALAAIGRLNMATIAVASNVYDPEGHYFDVRRQWFGLSITHPDGRQEYLDAWPANGESAK